MLPIFRKQATIVLRVLQFIKVLKNYSEQLRSAQLEYIYRRRKMLPLFPDDLITVIWINIMRFCHFLAAILFPIQLAYQVEEPVYTMCITLQILFAFDILVNMISCHIDRNLNLIYKSHDIIIYYLSHWFILDILSILPYELSDSSEQLNILKVIRVFKFFYYVRKQEYRQSREFIKKKEKITEDALQYESHIWIDLRIQKLLLIFMDMLLLTHLFACLLHWISSSKQYNYLQSFYWAFQTVTVIGYGEEDVDPNQFILKIIWMLIGVGFYSFTIGNITFILISSNPYQESEDDMALMDDLSNNTYMPDVIQQELLTFLKFNIGNNPFWGDESKHILESLPINLAMYTIVAAYKELFNKVPFLTYDINFTVSILPYITVGQYSTFESIYHIGQSASDFYFLIQGDIRLTDSQGNSVMRVMEGTIFGEIESFERTTRTLHAHALTKSSILICPSRFFFTLMKENTPLYFEMSQMYKRRKLLINGHQKQLRQQKNKLRRSNAMVLNEDQSIAECSSPAIKVIPQLDNRHYSVYQQDLILQLVGQRQARRNVLRDKMKTAFITIRNIIVRSNRKGNTLPETDQDYDIFMNLIQTRIGTGQLRKTRGKKVGKRMISNFVKVKEQEDEIQAFLKKTRQQALDRIQRMKLKDILSKKVVQQDNNCIKREQEIYYTKFHQQIYNEVQEEKLYKKNKQNAKYNKNLGFQFKAVWSSLNLISKQATQISMAKFQILQLQQDLDQTIEQTQQIIHKM